MANTAEERAGVVTFAGGPLTLVGPDLAVGSVAPDATLTGADVKPVALLGDSAGKVRLIIAIPSVDTSVCSLESKKFSTAARDLPAHVAVFLVSADLPFALGRWCGAEGVDNLVALSDYRGMEMARAYGLYIKEMGLFARAVFVVDKSDRVTYREIVDDITHEPDYEAALSAARAAG